MAEQNKNVVPGYVQKENNRKFRIRKDRSSDLDVDLEILEEGDYDVQKLSMANLPTRMNDGTSIRWFNSFAIKKNGQYINEKYRVKIAGLSSEKARIVIFDGNGDPYYYTGKVTDDTIELTDGDPAIGGAP